MSKHEKALRGWMIQQRDAGGLVPDAYFSMKDGEFASECYGTLYPSMQSAEAYCDEFCFKIGKDVEIVENGF